MDLTRAVVSKNTEVREGIKDSKYKTVIMINHETENG